MKRTQGFTLIEVLLALAVIAIALTALLRATSANINHTEQIKEKSISHWVKMQGIRSIQLGLVPIRPNQDLTEKTTMLGQEWYWRAHISPAGVDHVDKISITASRRISGPFTDALIGYRFAL